MIKLISHSADETEQIGEKIAKQLHGTEVIALFGGLGMGKYNIYHFDMYRVNSWDDLYSTGFFDYIDNGILVIEWSENIEGALPENAIRITIEKGESDDERIFEIEGVEI